MTMPPQPGPSPTPTPRPVTPGYVSPADYIESLRDSCANGNQEQMVKVGTVTDFLTDAVKVLRNAET